MKKACEKQLVGEEHDLRRHVQSGFFMVIPAAQAAVGRAGVDQHDHHDHQPAQVVDPGQARLCHCQFHFLFHISSLPFPIRTEVPFDLPDLPFESPLGLLRRGQTSRLAHGLGAHILSDSHLANHLDPPSKSLPIYSTGRLQPASVKGRFLPPPLAPR
jgi:hypothetical protein